MPVRPRILLVDSNEGDIELARLLIERDLPDCELVVAASATALAEAASEAAPSVVVFALDVEWTSFRQLSAMTSRLWPRAALIVFGQRGALDTETLSDQMDCNAVVFKTSSGFLGLPRTIANLLDRHADKALSKDILEQIPVASVRIDERGMVIDCNERFASSLERSIASVVSSDLGEFLSDDQARSSLRDFLGESRTEETLPVGTGGLALCLQRDGEGAIGCLLPAPAPGVRLLGGEPADSVPDEASELALLFTHDLRQPVQHIQRLLQRLEREPEVVSTDRDRTMQQLAASAERASNMLEGLSEYLSVTLHEGRSETVDLNECVARARDFLAPQIEANRARFECESLPSVRGDAVQLTHLFQNLFSNAIKFRTQAAPRITVSAEPYDGAHHIAVGDNGIGISAPHRERVFGAGQRLHTREEYPGSGMGLALCKRIVERHDGSIRVEPGANDTGATVVITLPQIEAANTRQA